MRATAVALALCALVVGAAVGEGGDDDSMKMFVPEVLPEVPKGVLRVTVGAREVQFGTEVTPTEAKDDPDVSWDADADAFHTLCVTNPDIPTAEQHLYGELVHWLVVNVPGSDLARGDVLMQYLSPGPPKQTGKHRYVALVFKQPGRLEFDEPRNNVTTLDDRFHFSVKKFAEKYKFESPALAGNYFRSSWDPTVDELFQIRKFRGQIVATIRP